VRVLELTQLLATDCRNRIIAVCFKHMKRKRLDERVIAVGYCCGNARKFLGWTHNDEKLMQDYCYVVDSNLQEHTKPVKRVFFY